MNIKAAFVVSMMGLCLISITRAKTIHPVFDYTEPTIQNVWSKGYSDASHMRNANRVADKSKRCIGTYADVVNPIYRHRSSYIWFYHPKLVSYLDGFNAKKKYFTDEEIQESQKQALTSGLAGRRQIAFHGMLSAMPTWRLKWYGLRRQQATPEKLNDIRVVLKVGNRVYQPAQQPMVDDIEQGKITACYDDYLSVPGRTYRWQTAGGGTCINSSGQIAVGAGAAQGVVQEGPQTVIVPRKVEADYYQTHFDVVFDLYDQDGTPRITNADNEIQVVVVCGGQEHVGKYRLTDWLRLF